MESVPVGSAANSGANITAKDALPGPVRRGRQKSRRLWILRAEVCLVASLARRPAGFRGALMQRRAYRRIQFQLYPLPLAL